MIKLSPMCPHVHDLITLTLIQILIHPSLHFLEPWDIPCLDLMGDTDDDSEEVFGWIEGWFWTRWGELCFGRRNFHDGCDEMLEEVKRFLKIFSSARQRRLSDDDSATKSKIG